MTAVRRTAFFPFDEDVVFEDVNWGFEAFRRRLRWARWRVEAIAHRRYNPFLFDRRRLTLPRRPHHGLYFAGPDAAPVPVGDGSGLIGRPTVAGPSRA